VLGTELPGLQRALTTTSLSGHQWLACVLLALALPIVVEAGKAVRRARAPHAATLDARHAVTPTRALADVTA
jgi:Ca2+-transporting ATPase